MTWKLVSQRFHGADKMQEITLSVEHVTSKGDVQALPLPLPGLKPLTSHSYLKVSDHTLLRKFQFKGLRYECLILRWNHFNKATISLLGFSAELCITISI